MATHSLTPQLRTVAAVHFPLDSMSELPHLKINGISPNVSIAWGIVFCFKYKISYSLTEMHIAYFLISYTHIILDVLTTQVHTEKPQKLQRAFKIANLCSGAMSFKNVYSKKPRFLPWE